MSTCHWITSGPTITSTTPAFVIPYVLTKPSALRRFWLATLLQEPVCCQGIRSHVCHTHGDHLSTRASSDVNTERHVSWLIPGTLDLFVATCKQWPLTMQDHFTLWLCKKAEAFEITDHFYVSRQLGPSQACSRNWRPLQQGHIRGATAAQMHLHPLARTMGPGGYNWHC